MKTLSYIQTLSYILMLCLALGVNAATYYIDYVGGNNANSGTDTNNAWQHVPGMQGWSGSYSHTAGDVFELKGGVTWPTTVFPLVIANGGSSDGVRDIYRTSSTWFTGASWTNACFDGEFTGIDVDNVHSFVQVNGAYVTFLNIEMKRLLIPNSAGWDGYGTGSITTGYSADGSTGHDLIAQGCYIHDWKPAYQAQTAYGGVLFIGYGGKVLQSRIWNGLPPDGYVGSSGQGIRNSAYAISNDITAVWEGINAAGTIAYNRIHDMPNDFEENSHPNAIYSTLYTGGTLSMIGNTVSNLGSRYESIFMSVYDAQTNITINFANQLVVGVPKNPAFDDRRLSIDANGIYVNILNSTLQGADIANLTDASHHFQFVRVANTHFINDSGVWLQGSNLVGTLTLQSNIVQTTAQASSAGYTSANRYQPTSASSPTVGTGTNLTSLTIFTTDILGRARPAVGLWNIGAYQFFTQAINSGWGIRPP